MNFLHLQDTLRVHLWTSPQGVDQPWGFGSYPEVLPGGTLGSDPTHGVGAVPLDTAVPQFFLKGEENDEPGKIHAKVA